MKNRLDEDYRGILGELVCNGREKEDRTGTGTLSKFGMQIKHDMSEGFPLLTTKRMPIKTIMTELKWFLKGDTNIKYLVDNGCNIWNGDAYKNYCKNWGGQNKYSVKTPILEDGVVIGSSNRKFTQEEFIEKIKTDDEFANKWGELGPVYGKQWRHWGGNIKRLTYGFIDKNDDGWVMRWSDLHSFGAGSHWCYTPIKNSDTINDSDIGKRVVFDFEADHEDFNPLKYAIINTDTKDEYENHIDQIANLINDLKTNPDSRRLMVNAWNVGELEDMTLPPCHYGFQCYVNNGKLSLMWNQRSVDTFLGLPFNIASYGMLLLLLCEEVGLKPGELIGNFGDTHLYKNHIEQAKEQINRDSFDLPTIKLSNVDILNGEFDNVLLG